MKHPKAAHEPAPKGPFLLIISLCSLCLVILKSIQSISRVLSICKSCTKRQSSEAAPQGPLHRSWQPARLHWTLGSHQDCWAGTGLPCKPSSAASGLAFWLTTTPVFLPAPPGSISETNSRSFRGVQGKRQTGKVLRNSTALAELMISSAGSTLLPFNYCNLFALLLITREHHRSLSMLRLISQKDGTSPAALMLPACTLLLLCTHSWKTPCRC